MRSRSYSGIALSSLLLFSISCGIQAAKVEEEKADKKDEGPSMEDPALFPDVSSGEAGDGSEDGIQTLVPAGGIDRTMVQMHQYAIEEPPDMKCPDGQMGFEGSCVDKTKVDRIIDTRKKKALDRVKAAKQGKQTADATYDLLEQQTAQVDKVEDDLDEIIEQLKEEKRAEKKEKGDL